MLAPNLLRVGTPEKVFVEAQDYSGSAFDVTLTVMDFPRKTREIDTKTVTLNATNNYLGLTEITVSDMTLHHLKGTHMFLSFAKHQDICTMS